MGKLRTLKIDSAQQCLFRKSSRAWLGHYPIKRFLGPPHVWWVCYFWVMFPFSFLNPLKENWLVLWIFSTGGRKKEILDSALFVCPLWPVRLKLMCLPFKFGICVLQLGVSFEFLTIPWSVKLSYKSHNLWKDPPLTTMLLIQYLILNLISSFMEYLRV